MKGVIFFIGLLLICKLSYAKLYACVDKGTDIIKGITNITDKVKNEWEQHFNLYEVDESFRGMQGYELKLIDGKIYKKTLEELEQDKINLEQEQKIKRKQKILFDLGLTEEILGKIKALE